MELENVYESIEAPLQTLGQKLLRATKEFNVTISRIDNNEATIEIKESTMADIGVKLAECLREEGLSFIALNNGRPCRNVEGQMVFIVKVWIE